MLATICFGLGVVLVPLAVSAQMALLPAGTYLPLYAVSSTVRASVAAFALDREPVTRGEFLRFVRGHAEWRRGGVGSDVAEPAYLGDWTSDLAAGAGLELRRPVTSVSWFAANAYCAARGKRLPTTDEWEYAAAASETERDASRDPQFVRRVAGLYATRVVSGAHTIGRAARNAFGVADLHELVWEWTLDFRATPGLNGSAHTPRGMKARDHDAFCASAALGASDPTNYPAFLRFAVRSGLTERSTISGVGFRCAANAAT